MTETATVGSGTLTPTSSETLPTVSVTLPTATESMSETGTASISASFSQSETFSSSASHSHSVTESVSSTIEAHNNYTMHLLPSYDLTEGHDIRVKITAILESPYSVQTIRSFNLSKPWEVQLRVYWHSASADIDCGSDVYLSRKRLLEERMGFGVSHAERLVGNEMLLSSFFTFTAPSSTTPFVICFKHIIPEVHAFPFREKWVLFTDALGRYRFVTKPSEVRYRLPAPSEGQFAVVELQSTAAWNFTYPASSCATDPYACLDGDNLKIVPEGTPCTFERSDFNGTYYGSKWVKRDGLWLEGAIEGLSEAAVLGGVGLFGTQLANPLVDVWSAWGVYGLLNRTYLSDPWPWVKRAYVYVQLPKQGRYELCYSSREQRADMSLAANDTRDELPVWQKLYPAGARVATPAFTVYKESVSWDIHDRTPDTYGEVIFSDTENKLTAGPNTLNENYWDSRGGDMFKLVPEYLFKIDKRWPVPAVGCWDTVPVTSVLENEAEYPIASTNLQRDSQNTFAATWVPHLRTAWRVCYRRTRDMSGYRLLPGVLRPRQPQEMPPVVTWYMNDTREGTWGPVVIETANFTEVGGLDSREWNRSANMGSAVRLVGRNKPCDYHTLAEDVVGQQSAAASYNGGMIECNSASAEVNDPYCQGTLADQQNVSAVAFYITLPREDTYKVCFRLGAWNWKVLHASDTTPYLDKRVDMPEAFLERQDWYAGYPLLRVQQDARKTITVVAHESREDMEVLFMIHDAEYGLTAARREPCPMGCSKSGDVLRVVPIRQMCDVNHVTWVASTADTFLSVHCPADGGSGLVSPTCHVTAPVAELASVHRLHRLINVSLPVYDDIVPYPATAYSVADLVGSVRLPAYSVHGGAEANTYKVCYKQFGMQNWILFNTTTIRQKLPYILTPQPGSDLVSGRHQLFHLAWVSFGSFYRDWNASRGVFHAKLVEVRGGPPRCTQPPASTEGEDFGSKVGKALQTGTTQVSFNLTVPHKAGVFSLCIRVGTQLSWYSPGSGGHYTVIDNGMRWYVEPGNQPVSGGLSTVKLLKCNPTPKGCDDSFAVTKFDTSPGRDAAKVVQWWRPCTEGSQHVGIESLEGNGHLDLGPADGTADTAEFTTILPAANDERVTYKICVKSDVLDGATVTTEWVEVMQSMDTPQQLVITENGLSSYSTQPSVVQKWTLDAALQPLSWTGTNASKSATALSGASSYYVPDPSAAVPTGAVVSGFYFISTPGTTVPATSTFKLVPRRAGNTCRSPPYEGATNIDALEAFLELDGVHLNRLNAFFQLPLEQGAYMVCFKVGAPMLVEQPWLVLANDVGKYSLQVVPSNFQVLVEERNATIIDGSLVNGTTRASWCSTVEGQGVPCDVVNNKGYQYDLLTVVHSTKICPSPTAAPLGGTTDAWFLLSRMTNVSAVIFSNELTGEFLMPPLDKSPSGRYKLCLYKAGQPTIPAGHVTRHGVSYHLLVQGDELLGGGTGFWKDIASQLGDPSKVLVTSSLQYNYTLFFTEYTTDTFALYAANSLETLIDPQTGQFSRTPLVRSGTTVDYLVQIALSDGTPVAAEYTITAMKCPPATDWGAGRCLSHESAMLPEQSFLVDVIDGECRLNSTEVYGWPKGAVRQFTKDGFVTVRVQYKSLCRGTFGCGVRFHAVNSKGHTIISNPFWLNTLQFEPDKISMNGVIPSHNSHHVVHCLHKVECRFSLAAYWQGIREYAPKGSISMLHSEFDYGTNPDIAVSLLSETVLSSTFHQKIAVSWGQGGEVTGTYSFELQPTLSTGSIYMNVTYGHSLYQRVEVSISRVQPVSCTPKHIIALDGDLSTSRTPSPVFLHNHSITPEFTALPGVYLESLVPYELGYTLRDSTGAPVNPEVGMSKWRLTAVVKDSIQNAVLGVMRDGDGELSIANLQTTPQSLEKVLDREVSGSDGVWRVMFRLLNGFGCSRFTGGCLIEFSLTHSETSEVVLMSVRTPVRVIGSTVRVSVSRTTTTVREGTVVTAEPGTVCGAQCWMPDEYHHGYLFTMIHTPGPSDGVSNTDNVMQLPALNRGGCVYQDWQGKCDVWGYTSGLLGNTSWGATWVLRASKPCIACVFTFHSTSGAGPDSYSASSVIGSVELSFVDEDIVLECAVPDVVAFPAHSTTSELFNISVTAFSHTTHQPAVYPTWWVFSDMTSDLTNPDPSLRLLKQGSLTGLTTLTVKMDGGTSVVRGLYFSSPQGFAGTTVVQIKFHALGTIYDRSKQGTVAQDIKEHSCTATITVQPTVITPVTSVEVEFSGSTRLCEGCDMWSTTIAAVREGIVMTAEFEDLYPDGVVKVAKNKNATVVPGGGPSSRPWKSPAVWEWDRLKGLWTAQVTLDSVHNPLETERLNNVAYTNGKVLLTLSRGLTTLNLITITYESSTESPARQLVFDICTAEFNGEVEVVTAPCKTINMWIVPSTPVDNKILVWSEPAAGRKYKGTGLSCGASPTEMRLKLATYYEISGALARTRYFVYGIPIAYRVTFPGQHFVQIGSTETNSMLVVRNSVDPSLNETAMLASGASHFTEAIFFGRDIAGSTQDRYPLRVDAVSLGSTTHQFTSAFTDASYYFSQPLEKFAQFDIASNGVTLDPECPPKRVLESAEHNYRTFSPYPGVFWNYATGVAQGIPFPVQVMVRTTANTRAWTFNNTYIRISKHSSMGCNDGGIMTVYALKPSLDSDVTALRPGMLNTSWDRGVDGQMVRMNMGAAVPWVVFSSPCESCVLKIDLCFTTATSVVDCLKLRESSEASDMLPLYPARSKVTKPFSVRKPSANSVSIVRQNVPPLSSKGTIRVGDTFSVGFEKVQITSGWSIAIEGPPTKLFLSTEGGGDPTTAVRRDIAIYGNGGFIGVSSRDGKCGVDEQEYRQSAIHAYVEGDAWPNPTFYFTRPCGLCRVKVVYELQNSAGVIYLREYGSAVGNVLEFKVVTCGVKWLLSPVAPTAVRKRQPFSVGAMRVDRFNFPSWDSNGTVPLVEKTADCEGNGGGGANIVSAPRVSDGVRALNGYAVTRMQFTKPCFRCGFVFGTVHYLTVLTDATQIIAVPHTPLSQRYTGTSLEITLGLYAADDLGYRSYLVSGPTYPVLQPRYQTERRIMDALTILPLPGKNYTVLHPTTKAGVTLMGGKPSVSIVAGGKVANGIPVAGEGDLGATTIKIEGPTSGYELSFAIAGMHGLPTRLYGDGMPPAVGHSVAAEVMVVEDGATANCISPVTQGSVCSVSVFTAGVLNVSGIVHYYLSSEGTADPATATADCNSCSPNISSTVPLIAGIGTVHMTVANMAQSTCTCTLRITPPPSLSSNSTTSFVMTWSRTLMTLWYFTSSNTLKVTPADQSMYTAKSVMNTVVDILLSPFDVTRDFSSMRGLDNIALLSVNPSVMIPAGCFVCYETESLVANPRCMVQVTEQGVVLRGYFAREGTCLLTERAIVGLPQSVGSTKSPDASLEVTVQIPHALHLRMVHDTRSETLLNFTGLTGRTKEGEAAAVVGVGAHITLDVLDSVGARVEGDNSMVVEVDTWNEATNTTITTTHTSLDGVVQVNIDAEGPSYCEEAPPCSEGWYFNVTKVHATQTTGVTTYNSTTPVLGPLYFVAVAGDMRVEGKFGELIRDVSEPGLQWIRGYPIDMSMQVLGHAGEIVDHTVDAVLRPATAPCLPVDEEVWTSCVFPVRDTCVFKDIKEYPACGTSGWVVDNKTTANSFEVTLSHGTAVVPLWYVGTASTVMLRVNAFLNPESGAVATSITSQIQMLRFGRISLENWESPASWYYQDPLNFTAVLYDTLNNVMVLDNDTSLIVSAECLTENSYVGVGLDFLSIVRFPVHQGTARIEGPVFSGSCKAMVLVVTCASGPMDTLKLCEQLEVATEQFEVTGNSTASGQPQSPNPIRVSMGMGVFQTQAAFLQYVQGSFDSTVFEAAVTGVLKASVPVVKSATPSHLCGLPVGTPWNDVFISDPDICVDVLNNINMRKLVVLQSSSEITSRVVFQVGTAVNVELTQLQDRVANALLVDAATLRAVSPLVFGNVDASVLSTSIVPTAAPTPLPTLSTPVPVTPVPSTYVPFTFPPTPLPTTLPPYDSLAPIDGSSYVIPSCLVLVVSCGTVLVPLLF